MPYSAAAVANQLLDRGRLSGRELTQIEIQKLVYFAHGWHLGLRQRPLISEQIEAWQYGPVVRKLYDEFRRFGSRPIVDNARVFKIGALGEYVGSEPTLTSMSIDDDAYANSLIGAIWQKYGTLAPFKLVELTHAIGSPWEKAWSSNLRVIPTASIQTYFTALAAQNG